MNVADYVVKLNRKNYIIFFLIASVGLEFLRCFSMSIFSVYYEKIGVSLANIGVLKSFQFLSWFVFEIPSGYISDRYGRIRVFKISVVMFSIAYFLIAFSKDFYLLAIAEFIYGIAFAINSGNLMGDFNDKHEKNEFDLNPQIFIAKLMFSIQLFQLIGGNIGKLIFNLNYKITFLVPAILLVILIIILNFFQIEDSYSKKTKKFDFFLIKEILTKKKFLSVFWISAFFLGSSQIIYNYWAIIFKQFDNSFVFTTMMLSSMLGMKFIKKLYKNKIKSLKLALTIYSIPLLLFFLNFPLWLKLICFFISQFGRGMMFVELGTLSNKIIYQEEYKSTILSVSGTLNRISAYLFLVTNSFMLKVINIDFLWSLNSLLFITIVFYAIKFIEKEEKELILKRKSP